MKPLNLIRNISTKKMDLNKDIPDSFGEAHLDVVDYFDGLFVCRDGSLGVLYRYKGINDEVLTPNGLYREINNVHSMLNRILPGIPEDESSGNVVIQIIHTQRKLESNNISNDEGENIFQKLLKNEEKELFDTGYFYDRSIYITIRYFPKIENITENNLMKLFKQFFSKKIKDRPEPDNAISNIIDEFKDILKTIENTTGGLSRLSHKDYIRLCQNMINASTDRIVVPNKSRIFENIYNYEIKDKKNYLKIGEDKNIRLYYVKEFPDVYAQGSFREFIDSLHPYNCDIILTLSHGSFNKKRIFQRSLWFEGRNPTIFKHFEQFLDNVGPSEPYSKQSLKLIVYNEKPSISGIIRSIGRKKLGTRLIEESQILTHMFSSALPLNCRPEQNDLKGRRFTEMRLFNSLLFAPIYADGPKKGQFLRPSRRFGPVSFDIFKGHGNKMTLLLGQAGGGKSVFMNLLIIEFLARFPDGIIRIIDRRTSYTKVARLMRDKAKIVEFSDEALKENPYSPFAITDWTMDDITNICKIIRTVILRSNKDIKMRGLHSSILRNAVILAFKINDGNRKMNPKARHVVWCNIEAKFGEAAQKLVNEKNIPQEIAQEALNELSEWTLELGPTGTYGFIFNAYEKNGSSENAQLIIYDLEGISDDIIKQIAAMICTMKILRDIVKLSLKIRKLVIFEEFGMLQEGEDEAQKIIKSFIMNFVKTCRKQEGQGFFISNEVADFHDKAAGKAVWGKATQKIFLPMDDMILDAKKAWGDTFSMAEWQIIEDLRLDIPNKRSEIYIHCPASECRYRGSIYNPLSKMMDIICSTTGPQVDKYNELVSEGYSIHKALQIMVEKYPYGENLGE